MYWGKCIHVNLCIYNAFMSTASYVTIYLFTVSGHLFLVYANMNIASMNSATHVFWCTCARISLVKMCERYQPYQMMLNYFVNLYQFTVTNSVLTTACCPTFSPSLDTVRLTFF